MSKRASWVVRDLDAERRSQRFWAIVVSLLAGLGWLAQASAEWASMYWVDWTLDAFASLRNWLFDRLSGTPLEYFPVWVSTFYPDVPLVALSFGVAIVITIRFRRHWLPLVAVFAFVTTVAEAVSGVRGWFFVYGDSMELPIRIFAIQAGHVFASPLLGGLAARRLLIGKAIDPACCTKCGYNLTGNVSGVCPECGEKI